jgi:hypothetical protein
VKFKKSALTPAFIFLPFTAQSTGGEILKQVFNPLQIGLPQLGAPVVIDDLRLPQDPCFIEFVIKLHSDRLAQAFVDQHVAQVIDHDVLGRLVARHARRLKFRQRKTGAIWIAAENYGTAPQNTRLRCKE